MVQGTTTTPPQSIEDALSSLRTAVGPSGQVALEQYDRLLQGLTDTCVLLICYVLPSTCFRKYKCPLLYIRTVQHASSAFDIALLGEMHHQSATHDAQVLAEVLRLLKPNGILYITEPTRGALPAVVMPCIFVIMVRRGASGWHSNSIFTGVSTQAERLRGY